WGTAATHYRVAIQERPPEVFLHYRLAIATSWLEMRDEATTEFEWVVANAAASSDEARVAREWLDAARKRRADRAAAGASGGEVKDERAGDSGLHGRVVWDNGQGMQPQKRLQLHVYAINDDGTSKKMIFQVRTDFEGNYRFRNLPAGLYKLTDDNVGTAKWRLKVEIKSGEDPNLVLGPDNSVDTRDD